FNLALGPLPERGGWVSAYVHFVRALRAAYPRAQVLLTEGPLVNDATDPRRPARTVLRAYLRETVRRLRDPRVHAFASRRYAGDNCDAHPTRAQQEAMARDLEPALRRLLPSAPVAEDGYDLWLRYRPLPPGARRAAYAAALRAIVVQGGSTTE